MFLRWIKGLAGDNNRIDAPADKASGVDVAQRACEYQALDGKKELDSLVNYGWPAAKRREFKGRVRQKVWSKVRESALYSDEEVLEEITEEITEKITEACENDPYYKRLFEK